MFTRKNTALILGAMFCAFIASFMTATISGACLAAALIGLAGMAFRALLTRQYAVVSQEFGAWMTGVALAMAIGLVVAICTGHFSAF